MDNKRTKCGFSKEDMIEVLIEEYEDFLKSQDEDYIRKILNSNKFDIRP